MMASLLIVFAALIKVAVYGMPGTLDELNGYGVWQAALAGREGSNREIPGPLHEAAGIVQPSVALQSPTNGKKLWDMSDSKVLHRYDVKRKVAVCVTGRLDDPDVTAPHLLDNLVAPLNADLFIHTSNAAEAGKIESHFDKSGRLRGYRLINDAMDPKDFRGADPYIDELADDDGSSWRELFKGKDLTFFSGLKLDYDNCQVNLDDLEASAGKKCRLPGNVMWAFSHLYGCKLLIEKQEQIQGAKYDRIMWTRADMDFVAPSPSLKTFQDSENQLGKTSNEIAWVTCRYHLQGGLCDHLLFTARDKMMLHMDTLSQIAKTTEFGKALTAKRGNAEAKFLIMSEFLKLTPAYVPDFGARFPSRPNAHDAKTGIIFSQWVQRCGWSTEYLTKFNRDPEFVTARSKDDNHGDKCSLLEKLGASENPAVQIVQAKGSPPKVAVCVVGKLRTFVDPRVQNTFKENLARPGVDFFASVDEFPEAGRSKLKVQLKAILESATTNQQPPNRRDPNLPGCDLDYSVQHTFMAGMAAKIAGCLPLIEKHEKDHGFSYDYVFRTRTDSVFLEPVDLTAAISSLKDVEGSIWDDHHALARRGMAKVVMGDAVLQAYSGCFQPRRWDATCNSDKTRSEKLEIDIPKTVPPMERPPVPCISIAVAFSFAATPEEEKKACAEGQNDESCDNFGPIFRHNFKSCGWPSRIRSKEECGLAKCSIGIAREGTDELDYPPHSEECRKLNANIKI